MLNTSSLDYYRGSSMEWGYPPGVKMVDFVADDMKNFIHPHWTTFSPVNPMMRYFLATVAFILFIFGIVGNYVVMYMFTKKKELRSPINNYIVNLALADMCMLWSQTPLYLYNVFNGGNWQFGPLACQMNGAANSVFGICSICTIGAMTIERYNVVVRGSPPDRLTYSRSFGNILLCWMYSMFWSIGPFFGYGKYIPMGTLELCDFDFMSRDRDNVNYSLAVLFTNYCAPLMIITYYNVNIVTAIFKHNSKLREQAIKMNVPAMRCNSEVMQMTFEIRYAKLVMTNVSLWVWAWTPFVGIVLQATLFDQNQLTPVLTTVPQLFARFACITNPLVLAYGHSKYRLALKKYMHHFCVFFINENELNRDAALTGTAIET